MRHARRKEAAEDLIETFQARLQEVGKVIEATARAETLCRNTIGGVREEQLKLRRELEAVEGVQRAAAPRKEVERRLKVALRDGEDARALVLDKTAALAAKEHEVTSMAAQLAQAAARQALANEKLAEQHELELAGNCERREIVGQLDQAHQTSLHLAEMSERLMQRLTYKETVVQLLLRELAHADANAHEAATSARLDACASKGRVETVLSRLAAKERQLQGVDERLSTAHDEARQQIAAHAALQQALYDVQHELKLERTKVGVAPAGAVSSPPAHATPATAKAMPIGDDDAIVASSATSHNLQPSDLLGVPLPPSASPLNDSLPIPAHAMPRSAPAPAVSCAATSWQASQEPAIPSASSSSLAVAQQASIDVRSEYDVVDANGVIISAYPRGNEYHYPPKVVEPKPMAPVTAADDDPNHGLLHMATTGATTEGAGGRQQQLHATEEAGLLTITPAGVPAEAPSDAVHTPPACSTSAEVNHAQPTTLANSVGAAKDGNNCAICEGVLFGVDVTCSRCSASFHAGCVKRSAQQLLYTFTCDKCAALLHAKRLTDTASGGNKAKRSKTGKGKVNDYHKHALSALV